MIGTGTNAEGSIMDGFGGRFIEGRAIGWRVAVAVMALWTLAACTAAPRAPVALHAPTTARAQAFDPNRVTPTGGIFHQENASFLFEDRKPREIGDLLTIQINENLNASQTGNSNAEKKTTTTATLPKITGLLGMGVNGVNLNAASDNNFTGTGATASTNAFTGAITVTVVEVLPNGNLMVAGEKQIGISRNSETLKLSGVIDPTFIQPGNIVNSTQVADVRLDVRGGGNIEEAQIQGWLGRFFNSWAPF
jgi:flagellar L-ring protein precursor FlgH